MSKGREFGISIPCYWGDVDLLSGCLASLRDFYPDTPVCLIPHGSVNIQYFLKRYGCTYIAPESVHPQLKKVSYGYGLTKMIAFWHSPFESFLHIDADTVCWGKFFDRNWMNDADFVANTSHEVVTADLIRQQYFDTRVLPQRWKPVAVNEALLFNSGTFGARRGLFSLEAYIELRSLMSEVPNAIFTDQGVLNLFIQLQCGQVDSIRFHQRDLQVVVPVFSASELSTRFQIAKRVPEIAEGDKVLIHWAGPKPLRRVGRRAAFAAPMDYFRLRHIGLQRFYGSGLAQRISDIFGSSLVYSARLGNRIDRLSRQMVWVSGS